MPSELLTTAIPYDMTLDNTVAAIDIGNTQVKILLGKESFSFPYKEGWVDSVFSLFSPDGRMFLGVSSVVPQNLLTLKQKSKEYAAYTLVVLDDVIRHESLPINFSAIEGMGMDRMLGLYGALQYSLPPFITVDCGTAITINAVQRDFHCIGGAIAPGITTQLRALHHFTGQLPLVEPTRLVHATGRTTHEAIAIGVIRGACGAIKEIIGNVVEKEFAGGKTPPVFITGGDAPLLLQELGSWDIQPIHVPNLVREGIRSVTQTLVEHGVVSE